MEWQSLTRGVTKAACEQILGLTLVNDAAVRGAVVVSAVDVEGARAMSGVRVGDVLSEVVLIGIIARDVAWVLGGLLCVWALVCI